MTVLPASCRWAVLPCLALAPPALALTTAPARSGPVPADAPATAAPAQTRAPAPTISTPTTSTPPGPVTVSAAQNPPPATVGNPRVDIFGKPIEVRAGDILVVPQKPKGLVDVPQAPVTTFDEQQIESYGVTSITDLLAAIAPETNSGRGRGATMPAILVNGQRIGSFRELRDYPPEALLRVEILPEEVALRFGYPPDQRVVNFVLKDRFNAHTGETQASVPDRGGTYTGKLYASLLNIDHNRRFNLALQATHTSPLSEADRGVAQTATSLPTVPTDPNPAAFRSLVADSSAYSANGTWTLPIGHGRTAGTVAINGTATRNDSTSLSGLNTVTLTAPDGTAAIRTLAGALTVAQLTDTAQASVALNKPLADWQLAATVDSSYAVSTRATVSRANTAALVAAAATGALAIDGALPATPPGASVATRNRDTTVNSLATLIGHPAHLPAGKLALTLKLGFAYAGQSSASTQATTPPAPHLDRGDASGGFNLAVPLTSRKADFGAALGDLTLNISAGADRLSASGSGWLTNWSAGLTWGITPKLNLQASFIANQAAPTLDQLGDVRSFGYNVPVYDFATGRSVLVTTISGGNPALLRESEHDIKLGANWTLPFLTNSNLLAEYFDNRSNNVATGFPVLTPAIEAAFPGRVTRNTNGIITAIDESPVNLAEQHEVRLRWGFNLFGNLGQPMAPPRGNRLAGMFGGGDRGDGGGGGGPPPGGGGGFGGGDHGGSRGGGGGGFRGPRYPGRWNLSIYHTVQFVDAVQVTQTGPRLDLLDGDALASSGGVAVHTVEVDGGAFYKGLGIRLGGTWTAPTHVQATGAPASSSLRFGALAKFNLRGFIDFNQRPGMIAAVPFLKGARLSVMANNILGVRQKVTDGTGATPLSYQPDLIDPLGRVIGVELRKLF